MLRIPIAIPLAAALFLSGCASTVTTQVTSFHQLADSLQGRRFVITPSPEQQTSLEFGTYANLVREALVSKGLVDAGAGRGAADLGVALSYGVTGSTSGFRSGTGGYAGIGAGSGGGFSMSGVGIGIGFPIGGGGATETQYQRNLTVQIDRLTGAPSAGQAASGTRVFEAQAISEGESASLAPVMRAMVQAIFQEFPGPSGATRVVRVPLDETR